MPDLRLAAIGVLIGDGGLYRVADHWAAVSALYAPIAFQTLLDSADAVAHALEHAVSGDYDDWTLFGDVRLALARAVTFAPTSPQPPAILETLLRDHAPELHPRLADGGRYLEVDVFTHCTEQPLMQSIRLQRMRAAGAPSSRRLAA